MRDSRCETCKHWFRQTDIHGKCFRYPPIWGGQEWFSPDTHQVHWCGEHKRKNNETT